MLKCFVAVLCVITIVFCAPGRENLREKQSTPDQIYGASRTKRQNVETIDILYLDPASIDLSKLEDLQRKESSHLAPVNDVTNPGQMYQQLPEGNLELVTQNSDYIVYKLKSTGDAPLSTLSDNKKAQGSENQYYSYGSRQYSGVRNPPPPSPLPDHDEPPPPPPDHHPPYPPPNHHPSHPPLDDYRSNHYDRNTYYDRRPAPQPDGDRSRRFNDDTQSQQISFDRPPPPHRGGPPPWSRGSLPRDGSRPPQYEEHSRHNRGPLPGLGGPPRHHGGPPDRYDRGPPSARDGPPGRFDRGPPPHRGGPPNRYDNRLPPPPDHYDDRQPPPQDGPPDRSDNRPPHDRLPPTPPNDRRPPHDREEHYDQGSENIKNFQKEDNTDKLIEATQTSSTTETDDDDDDDDQYLLDVRFNDDDQKVGEAIKRVVSARSLSPYKYQAGPVTPEY